MLPYSPPSVASPSLSYLGPQSLTFHVQATLYINFLKKIHSLPKKSSGGKCYNNLLFLFPYQKKYKWDYHHHGVLCATPPCLSQPCSKSFSPSPRGESPGREPWWLWDSSLWQVRSLSLP